MTKLSRSHDPEIIPNALEIKRLLNCEHEIILGRFDETIIVSEVKPTLKLVEQEPTQMVAERATVECGMIARLDDKNGEAAQHTKGAHLEVQRTDRAIGVRYHVGLLPHRRN